MILLQSKRPKAAEFIQPTIAKSSTFEDTSSDTGTDVKGRLCYRRFYTKSTAQLAKMLATITSADPNKRVWFGQSCAGIVWPLATAIAATFTSDCASLPAQAAGYFGIRITLPLHSIYDISFVHGKMVV